jgi:hypothetical protein
MLRGVENRANTPDMRRLVPASVVLASALLGSAHADGDALVDMLGPREIAVGEAMRGAATGPSAIALNPAGLPLNHELVFEGGYGYRASDQASLVHVAACDSTNMYPGCFYYDYAGSNPELGGMTMHRAMHIAGTSLGYPVSPMVTVGTSLKYYHFSSDLMTDTNASGFNFDLGTTLRISEQMSFGLAGYNLWGAESPQFARAAGGGVVVNPIQISSSPEITRRASAAAPSSSCGRTTASRASRSGWEPFAIPVSTRRICRPAWVSRE